MKVFITVTTDIYFDQRIKRIADALQQNGYDVTVVGRNKGNINSSIYSFKHTLINCFFKRSFLFYAEFNIKLFFFLLFKKCDIYYASDLDTILPLSFIARLKNKKLVFDAHEYFEESIEIINKPFVSKVWECIGRFSIPMADLRFTVSESLAEELSAKYRVSFHVIRNVPEIRYGHSQKERNKIIWYQGAINKGRGLETMVEAMKELAEYHFLLAGEGDIFIEITELIKKSGLQERVRLLGKLNYSEMTEYATKSYIGIDLLESDSLSYYYSLSNKTFDYIQSALPCIQMNFPEYKKLHQQYTIGVLIDSVNKLSIVNAIQKLEDTEFYNSCVVNTLNAAKIYHWNAEKELLLDLFKKFIGKP